MVTQGESANLQAANALAANKLASCDFGLRHKRANSKTQKDELITMAGVVRATVGDGGQSIL